MKMTVLLNIYQYYDIFTLLQSGRLRPTNWTVHNYSRGPDENLCGGIQFPQMEHLSNNASTACDHRETTFIVNGETHILAVDATEKLSDVLRKTLGLTGLKIGCGEGECGACTVLFDDVAVNSCMVLAFQADGARIETIEGQENPEGVLSVLQRSFLENGAVQCGYCTPGMVMACEGLLRKNSSPSRDEIRHALAGNICRCTGFNPIVDAVQAAAREMKK